MSYTLKRRRNDIIAHHRKFSKNSQPTPPLRTSSQIDTFLHSHELPCSTQVSWGWRRKGEWRIVNGVRAAAAGCVYFCFSKWYAIAGAILLLMQYRRRRAAGIGCNAG